MKNIIFRSFLLLQNFIYYYNRVFTKYRKTFFLGAKLKEQSTDSCCLIDNIENDYILKKNNEVIYVSPAEQHFYINARDVICDNRGQFFRLTKKERKRCRKSIKRKSLYSSGYFIEFRINVNEFWIEVNYLWHMQLTNMTVGGISGLDVFIKLVDEWKYVDTIKPANLYTKKVTRRIKLGYPDIKTVRIYLPNYASVRAIYLGFMTETIIYPHQHKYAKPIIFYGSSITQGCAAEHVGDNYVNKVSRKLGIDPINYGFSESAFGEPEIAHIIANIDSFAIIIEYDHNATIGELKKTHYNFYKIIRKKQKTVPIILISRLSGGLSISQEESNIRFEIINQTYQRAKALGDNNILIVNGNNLLEDENKLPYFADDRHPNSKGMEVIYYAILEALGRLYEEE